MPPPVGEVSAEQTERVLRSRALQGGGPTIPPALRATSLCTREAFEVLNCGIAPLRRCGATSHGGGTLFVILYSFLSGGERLLKNKE